MKPSAIYRAATLALLLAATSVAAQERVGAVSGRVVSSRDGQPLGLVQVDLAGTTFTVVTGDDGTFHVEGLAPGSYELQTTLVGFSRIRQPFTLAPGEAKAFDVVLTPSTITLTDSTSVTAGVFDVAGSSAAAGFSLGGDEARNLASVLADDPLRAVQHLPGVTANDDFSSEFSVRGAPFDRVGLYLDGVLLHAPLHTTDGQPGNGSLTIFSGELVDEMTLYQGAWPVRYSNRTAGVLAVETRPGTREDVRIQVSASASNAGFLAEGPLTRSRKGSWVVALRQSYLQYILNRIDFGDQAPLAFGFADVQARVDIDVSPRHTLNLSVLDGSSSVNRSRFRAELGPNTVMTSAFRSTIVNLGSRFASPRLLLSSHLAWSGERGHVENRDAVALSTQDYSGATARSDATAIWNQKSTLEFGGQFRHERQDGRVTQLLYAPTLVTTLDHALGGASQAGAYAQESLQLAHTRVTVGARVDGHSLSPARVASPYASVSFSASTRTRLQFDWGRYGQFPELSQYLSSFAHGRVQPERATDYEALIEQRLDERTRLRLEVYDRQDRSLLARPALDPRVGDDGAIVHASPEAPLLNSQHGHSRGLQVYLQRRTANGFAGWVSYTYGRATTTDDTFPLAFPSDYDQRHTVNVFASRRLRPTVNLSAHVTYGSGMPLPGFYRAQDTGYALASERNHLRAPSYQRADVRLNKVYVKPRLDATLYVEVINVSNHTNRDFDTAGPYDPVTGRTQPGFYSMFPILPSAGMVITFGRGTARKAG